MLILTYFNTIYSAEKELKLPSIETPRHVLKPQKNTQDLPHLPPVATPKKQVTFEEPRSHLLKTIEKLELQAEDAQAKQLATQEALKKMHTALQSDQQRLEGMHMKIFLLEEESQQLRMQIQHMFSENTKTHEQYIDMLIPTLYETMPQEEQAIILQNMQDILPTITDFAKKCRYLKFICPRMPQDKLRIKEIIILTLGNINWAEFDPTNLMQLYTEMQNYQDEVDAVLAQIIKNEPGTYFHNLKPWFKEHKEIAKRVKRHL